MVEKISRGRIAFRIILGIFVIVGSFVVIDKGFYMDEAGLLSIYKGIYQGNRMFIDSWGPLLLGGLLAYPLFSLYYGFLEPILLPIGCGFVLFTRVAYLVVRLIIAIYLYLTIRRTRYKNGAFITAIVYYAFFISFKNFSYKSFCDFAIILFICWMYRFLETKNAWYFLLMGLATCAAILAYPTMILLPVVLVIGLILMTYNGYSMLKPIIVYIVTCLVCGAAVMLYLQFSSGIAELIPQLTYTGDSAYESALYVRLGQMLLSYLFFFIVAYVPVVVLKLFSKLRYISERSIRLVLSIYWIIFMIAIFVFKYESISLSRLIYGFLIIFFWYPFFISKKADSEYTEIGKYKVLDYDGNQMLKLIFALSVVVQFIWAISTNQEVAIPGYMSYYVVLAVIMLADEELEGLGLLKIGVVVFVLYFSVFWVAEDMGGYSDILEHRTYVTYGAYTGIALNDTDYQMNESNYNLLTKYVSDEDKLFVLYGYSYSAYLNTDARQGVGSPYSRAGVGQNRVLEYWEVNPENIPDYVLINPTNIYYFEYEAGETAEYIAENYPTIVATDGDFILLTR